jgi:hypothetical protein
LEVAAGDPTLVLKWIIDHLDHGPVSEGTTRTFEDRTFWTVTGSVLDGQSLNEVDLAKAAAVLPLLGWHEQNTADVTMALGRARSDDLAVDPLSTCQSLVRDGARSAAHALLTAAAGRWRGCVTLAASGSRWRWRGRPQPC